MAIRNVFIEDSDEQNPPVRALKVGYVAPGNGQPDYLYFAIGKYNETFDSLSFEDDASMAVEADDVLHALLALGAIDSISDDED